MLELLLSNYSLGSDYQSIEAVLSFEFNFAFGPVYVCAPGQSLPVIFSREAGKIDQANWGIQSSAPNSTLFPWARIEGIIKNTHTRSLIRNNRCLIPASGFFIMSGSDTYFIYLPKDKVVTFGAVWKVYKDKDTDNEFLTFSIISCPSSGALNRLSNRIPLIIHPSNRRIFLKKERPLMDITRILKKDHKLDFNGFRVNPDLLYKKNISKKDFTPVGDKLNKARKFPEKAILGGYYYHQS